MSQSYETAKKEIDIVSISQSVDKLFFYDFCNLKILQSLLRRKAPSRWTFLQNFIYEVLKHPEFKVWILHLTVAWL